MAVTASTVFDFLELHAKCSIVRHEVYSADFGRLRRSLRMMILRFHESEDNEALDAANRLRTLLSEWLTVPVPFSESMQEGLKFLGDPDAFGRRWGGDMRSLFCTAMSAAENLRNRENPLCTELRQVIQNLRDTRQTFKIYCHRTSLENFNYFLKQTNDLPLTEDIFLHSSKDYREVVPFDVLIKVGPLRSRGWGAAPDALLSAPRFFKLIQVVWSGCGDEPGFGYDPVASAAGNETRSELAPNSGHGVRSNEVIWTSETIHSNDAATAPTDPLDEDEFLIFRDLNKTRRQNGRRATIVQIDEGQGIPYPPLSRVLSFDPRPNVLMPIALRIPGETLVEGMFIIRSVLLDIDSEGPLAEHGYFSRIWKERLKEMCKQDAAGLIEKLHRSGLDLVHLGSALNHWCKSPSTVIHAPQQKRHFEILMKVMSPNFPAYSGAVAGARKYSLWEYAWKEICSSRGVAIQAGVVGHEHVEEKLIGCVTALLPDIRRIAKNGQGFSLAIPEGEEVQGVILINSVLAIEEGFLVPENELKLAHELNEVEQWRA
jgi:hypothetical protein